MVSQDTIKKVVYFPIIADLFHYGHLRSLKFANQLGDYLICGVLTEEAIQNKRVISNLEERKKVIENLKFIDRILVQDKKDSTEVLKKIHEEFPEAELILVRDEDWNYFPELDYLKSIKGRIETYPNYARLSDQNIFKALLEQYKGDFKNISEFADYFKINPFEISETSLISTKANTLKALKPLLKHSKIEDFYIFTVSDWKEKKEDILSELKNKFNSKVVVRSSAISEDTFKSSMAGYFYSALNVNSNNKEELVEAINKVVKSYINKGSENLSDQVLIQKQTESIILSGVVFTRSLENNSPYYAINYDDKTGLSNTVTRGTESKTIKISKFADPKNYDERFHKLVTAISEIEDIIPNLSLDIEFAITKEQEVFIFQVRPVIVNYGDNLDEEIKLSIKKLKQEFFKLSKRPEHIFGNESYFADMPDWNPAEVIGDSPRYLDYSLYSYLITDSIWHEARKSQGYRNVSPAKLVILFGNKPYVDVRNTFNSFIPNTISDGLAEKLVNFYLNKLKNNPELQDKVEFDIVYTCYDLSFDEKSKELIKANFSYDEIKELKQALLGLTNNLLENYKGLIEKEYSSIDYMLGVRQNVKTIDLKSNLNAIELVQQAKKLLESCKKGTLQFSRLARLAFIGKIILKSMLRQKIIDQTFYDAFLMSINTVATKISNDFDLLRSGKLSKEKFLVTYGHLRPGTYDITSLRYDLNQELLNNLEKKDNFSEKKTLFSISKEKHNDISKVLKEHKLKIDSESFFDFIKSALESRELLKFEFTKNISDALELIARAGEKLGFSREDLSHLDIDKIFHICESESSIEEIQKSWLNLIEFRKREREIYKQLILSPIIFSEKDFDVISTYLVKPNFITQKKIKAETVNISDCKKEDLLALSGKIILLESGDPGYDWIFTKNIVGLITKYGGVASHMSIRCAEFGLPAAIGCGSLFDKLKNSSSILLDCEGNKIDSL
ncbi:adenylyltransferase/cytidyltransferase family protein [Candidatus Woesearchaeota archaeon]|nr:adenylyltransferase/cytidyltransferase family protein [Candidatus Woesearchaeota archaeon]